MEELAESSFGFAEPHGGEGRCMNESNRKLRSLREAPKDVTFSGARRALYDDHGGEGEAVLLGEVGVAKGKVQVFDEEFLFGFHAVEVGEELVSQLGEGDGGRVGFLSGRLGFFDEAEMDADGGQFPQIIAQMAQKPTQPSRVIVGKGVEGCEELSLTGFSGQN